MLGFVSHFIRQLKSSVLGGIFPSKNLKANILVNGFTTESINIEQSVKQRDALTLGCAIMFIILGTPVFTHYTSSRRWYAPNDMVKINDSIIERVTEMGKKKRLKKD